MAIVGSGGILYNLWGEREREIEREREHNQIGIQYIISLRYNNNNNL